MKHIFKSFFSKNPFLKRILKPCYRFLKPEKGIFRFYLLSVADIFVPKSKNIWVFPVHFYLKTFSDNIRAVYEEVKDDNDIIKVILTRDKPIDFFNPGKNTVILPMKSWKAYWYLLKCKVIFIQHSLRHDFYPLQYKDNLTLSIKKRKLVNLWHGIAVKSIIAPSTGIQHKAINKEKKYYLITASSLNDWMVMVSAFYPVKPSNVIVTGSPRNDFVKCDENKLPELQVKQLNGLKDKLGSKKLVVYAPTYREINLGGKSYNFSEDELNELKHLLDKHNTVLGFRLHYHNRNINYNQIIDNEYFIDLDQTLFPDMSVIIRAAEVVISDYSGLMIDTLYANKTIINFTYDYAHYGLKERGFSYPLDLIAPLPLCYNFQQLTHYLDKALSNDLLEFQEKYKTSQKLFFENHDASNSKRLVDFLKKSLCL